MTMAHHEQYILKVTAGHSYNPATHQDVHVNSSKPIAISSEHIDARIHVRIKDFRGLPANSPSTSPYFSHSKHIYDRYSISFTFKPKKTLSGDHLVFGNDFDHPIRDRLPPLFDKAFGIVKWWIDPGLDGDVYGNEPYLYGPLLSSINVFNIGTKGERITGPEEQADNVEGDGDMEVVFEEGAEADGHQVRKENNIPDDSKARQKHFLTEARRKEFQFEEGRVYACDFFNPYLDFNEFALKIGYGLPTISIVSHWDGQPLRSHSVRYVLKDRATNTELFVLVFQLVPAKDAEKNSVNGQVTHEQAGAGSVQGKSASQYVDEGVD
ncbi:DUF1769-domain-containing protein [Lepidopterella palustris CBS 459.81]|uniref:DUF1769-domain-containing protein n=1 Tax=Lepidopterella palustris CBS 459.81 TaxID=1314670 RepID=A0A8E2ELS0_9PEZI|nr:DUF1769-domain-containing protein [Lepidopterella palustris CBS 459.81]